MPHLSWRWFGVKTVFRTGAEGAGPDAPTLVEERVVLLRARTPDEAIRAAERAAAAYAGEPYRNRVGEVMLRRYLGACHTYELFGDDADRLRAVRGRVEAFSDTRIVPAGVADGEVLARLLGNAAGEDERRVRWERFVEGGVVERYEREAGGP